MKTPRAIINTLAILAIVIGFSLSAGAINSGTPMISSVSPNSAQCCVKEGGPCCTCEGCSADEFSCQCPNVGF